MINNMINLGFLFYLPQEKYQGVFDFIARLQVGVGQGGWNWWLSVCISFWDSLIQQRITPFMRTRS